MKKLVLIVLLVSATCFGGPVKVNDFERDLANHTVISAGIAMGFDLLITTIRTNDYLTSVNKKFVYQLNCAETKELRAIQNDKLLAAGLTLLFGLGKELSDLDKTGFDLKDLGMDGLGAWFVLFDVTVWEG